jgi:hypothetical protein
MYDINLIPINFNQGQLRADLAGFYAAGPPRRPARGRGDDLLIFSLSLGGSLQIPPQTQHEWLNHLTKIFYKSSGSVTAAMRTVIETLNLTLMEKNLKSVQGGGALTGEINLTVVHRQYLYIAQCGLTHAYVITRNGFEHFYDSSMVDRGLGLSRTPTIRYFQTELARGGYLFMTSRPPEGWREESLYQETFPSLEGLRRRLLNQAPPDLSLGLVEISPGEGRINLVRPVLRPEGPVEETPESRQTTRNRARPPQPVEDLRVSDLMPDQDVEEQPAADRREDSGAAQEDMMDQTDRTREDPPVTAGQPDPRESQPEPLPSRYAPKSRAAQNVIRPEPIRPGADQSQRRSAPDADPTASVRETLSKRREAFQEKGIKGLAAFFDAWHRMMGRVQGFFKDLAARWMPEDSEGLPRLSRSSLLFIAVAVPLVVVAIAVGVYLARGKDQQYDYYYAQAYAAAEQAVVAENPSAARSSWAQTLVLLEQAETYRTTEELDVLRMQAQEALDLLDGATRLEYHPAIVGELFSGINVDRIVSFGADLYLFDSEGGRILHALRTDSGYEVNSDFVCMSGQYEGQYIDDLVDMTALPINNIYQAHVLGVDGQGNVIYCASDQDPVVMALPSPAGSEAQIKRIAYSSGFLYLLDPASARILVYASDAGQFLEAPSDYFDAMPLEERPDVTAAVDLAVNGRELYLLREDGYLAACVDSGFGENPVSCSNPAVYMDGRPGKEDQTVIMPEAAYDSLLFTSPPDPSIYLMEAINADIYRFSVRLTLYHRYRPDFGNYEILSPQATAFTVGLDRIAFLAFGHQVFFAYIE